MVASASWALVPRDAATTVRTSATEISVTRNDSGLQLTLRTLRGPYFTRELLPVTLVLANHSRASVAYSPGFSTLVGPCNRSALSAELTANGQYLSPLSIQFFPSCPMPFLQHHYLQPGHDLRIQGFLALPGSGLIDLAARVSFDPTARVATLGLPVPGGRWAWIGRAVPGIFASSHAPFASGWPHLTLQVASGPPAGRTVRLVRRDHVVYVYGPPHLHNLVAQELWMASYPTEVCISGSDTWMPLQSNVLSDASQCGGDDEKWQVLVGAPSYAVAGAV